MSLLCLLSLNLKWCRVLYEHVTSDLMSLNLQTFLPALFLLLLLIFSLFLPDDCRSPLAVTPLPLSDGLFCCLKHLIGGQVYIIRGEFSVAAFISTGRCSSIFLLSRFLVSSSIPGVRLANASTWMLKVWSVENLSANECKIWYRRKI